MSVTQASLDEFKADVSDMIAQSHPGISPEDRSTIVDAWASYNFKQTADGEYIPSLHVSLSDKPNDPLGLGLDLPPFSPTADPSTGIGGTGEPAPGSGPPAGAGGNGESGEGEFGKNDPAEDCKDCVSEPGFWEGMIPLWGSGKSAIAAFQRGQWMWGLVNTGIAVTDVFLVKSIATAAVKAVTGGSGKLAVAASIKESAEEAVKAAEKAAQEAAEKATKEAGEKATQEAGEQGARDAAEHAGKPHADYNATLGKAASNDYKGTFFKTHPELQGEVVVHHAIEQQVLTRYPGVLTEAEMHSMQNLRGIPKEINADVHLSKIRKAWNEFYRRHPTATKEELLRKATEIDRKFGQQFLPLVGK